MLQGNAPCAYPTTKGMSSNAARMPQPCNELAPEERADILRVRPQGALCFQGLPYGTILAEVVTHRMLLQSVALSTGSIRCGNLSNDYFIMP